MLTNVNLSTLDLNLLLVLDAVLSEQSVARAAKRLHVTPPAVSNALARLRGALGDPIVTRSGRGIVPTPRAQRLGAAIHRALGEIDDAIHGEAFDPQTSDARFTLGIADAGQLARLPGLAAMLARAMPNARLRVVHVDTMVALGGLAATEVDVAVGVTHAGSGLHRTKLYDEHSSLVARRDHPRLGKRASRRDLVDEAHVEVNVALGKESRAVVAAYAALGVARRVAVVVPSFAAALAIVGRSDLVTTVPASVVDVLGPAFGVRTVPSPLRVEPLPMHMTWHERTDDDPAMMFFRDLVKRSLTATGR